MQRLEHTHDTDGPVKVSVSADGLPVFITVDLTVQYSSVDVVTNDDGRAIWAGGTGFRGSGFGVEVGAGRLASSMRGGSYVSGGGEVRAGGPGSVVSGGGAGGSVRATGRGSIASGGSIVNAVTGDGARIIGAQKRFTPEPGVYLTVPEGCIFSLKGSSEVSVRRGDRVTSSLGDAEMYGWLEVKR